MSVRRSDCKEVNVSTGVKRRAPIDFCMRPVGEFCACRALSEAGCDGTLGGVIFGLKADVEATHFLCDLIDVIFDTESATFRRGDI